MQRYDLTRMGPAQFERMVQALLVAQFGPSVKVHGTGPDGGKDASINEPLPLCTQGRNWDGLTVVQVKHKEEVTVRKSDAQWLVARLKDEFKGWAIRAERDERARTPDQLLIVTNISLSPAEQGGEELVEAFIKENCASIGLKAWDVWHADKVLSLLDNHTGVRQTYLGFIAGDLVQVVFEDLVSQRQEIQDAVCAHLASSFKAEQFADIDQAGAGDDLKVPLARVFVDIPNSRSTGNDAVTASLIRDCDKPARPPDREANPTAGRTVLIGGPGQGKSTIGRFLCQIYRAELLDMHDHLRASPNIREEIERVRALCIQEKIPRPRNLRFPVFIRLTQFADRLAENKVSSVLGYIASRVGDHVDPAMIQKWLRHYPWIVFLDGLDEVPVSANRDRVLAAIDEFIDIATASGSDIVLVASSRPQGYGDDFSSFRKMELGPLQTGQALRYADRLIRIRHGDGSERAEIVSTRLQRAARQPETARLMSNPLQVTILVVLLAHVGHIPHERFKLFSRFYDIICDREIEKNTPAAIALRTHRPHIDDLHAHIGLLLQRRSTEAGTTESVISRAEVQDVLRQILDEEGFEDDRLSELVDQLMSATTERLVFLVALRDDKFGFELRSLQEYCASRALLSGSDEVVQRNLEEISCSDYWRNVMMFACGQIFSDNTTRRDAVIMLCHNLNDGIVAGLSGTSGALMGSRLAFDLLADGVSPMAPRYQKSLMKLATNLLNFPYDPRITSIAHLENIDAGAMKILESAVRDFLETSNLSKKLAGLRFHSARAASGNTKSLKLLRHHCEAADLDTRLQYLLGAIRTGDFIIIALTCHELLNVGPTIARQIIRRLDGVNIYDQALPVSQQASVPRLPGWIYPLLAAARHDFLRSGHVGSSPLDAKIIAIGSTSSKGETEWLAEDLDDRFQKINWTQIAKKLNEEHWEFLREAAAFAANPNRISWGNAIDALMESRDSDVDAWFDTLPWPLALWREGDRKPIQLEKELRGWRHIQNQWKKAIPQNMSEIPRLEVFPRGIPIVAAGEGKNTFDGDDGTDYVELTHSILRFSNSHYRRAAATWMIRRINGDYGEFNVSHFLSQIDGDVFVTLAESAESVPLAWVGEVIDNQSWDPILAKIGRLANLEALPYTPEAGDNNSDLLVERLLRSSHIVGLARLAAHLPLSKIPDEWDCNDIEGPAGIYSSILAIWSSSWPRDAVDEGVNVILSADNAGHLRLQHWSYLQASVQTATILANLSLKIRDIDTETAGLISQNLLNYYAKARMPNLDFNSSDLSTDDLLFRV
jgi:hypothetical protein